MTEHNTDAEQATESEHITEPRDSKAPDSDPPGAVSNQNGEEAESGHREDGTHPEPRTRGHGAE